MVLGVGQVSHSSIKSTQEWDDEFDVEFRRNLNSALGAAVTKTAKDSQEWLSSVTYPDSADNEYRMCSQLGETGNCISGITTDLEQNINVALNSKFKAEIIQKIRLYQSIKVEPSSSIWISDITQTITAEIVNDIVSDVLRDVSFYNEQVLAGYVRAFEDSASMQSTVDAFNNLANNFTSSISDFGYQVGLLALLVLLAVVFGILLYNKLSAKGPSKIQAF